MVFFTIFGIISFGVIALFFFIYMFEKNISSARWYRDLLDFFGVPILVWFYLPKMNHIQTLTAKVKLESKFSDRPHAKWALHKINQHLNSFD